MSLGQHQPNYEGPVFETHIVSRIVTLLESFHEALLKSYSTYCPILPISLHQGIYPNHINDPRHIPELRDVGLEDPGNVPKP